MDGIGSLTSDAASLRYSGGIDRTVINLGNEADENEFRFENLMSGTEQARIEEEVRVNNRNLQIEGRQIKQVMDKDDYLTLLITQLQNQDPTSPMEDREFIAQMAQFSSLEQMTNIASGFQSMSAVLSAGQATSMLGREVEVIVNGNAVSGKVQAVTRGDYPQVLVDGTYYDVSDVSKISEINQEIDISEKTTVAAPAAASAQEQTAATIDGSRAAAARSGQQQ
jgi:flagellar basal-body rod modification protein FlgD